jgi:hypothetical protein
MPPCSLVIATIISLRGPFQQLSTRILFNYLPKEMVIREDRKATRVLRHGTVA